MQALEAREQRIVQQYRHVRLSAGNERPVEEDLGKWLFLRRRLAEQKLDVYDHVFSDQRIGEIFLPNRLEAGSKNNEDSTVTHLTVAAGESNGDSNCRQSGGATETE